MTLTEYPDLEQGSEEWLAARCGLVTASVVGKLVTSRALGAIEFDCPECGALENAPCMSKVRRGGEPGAPIKTLHQSRTDVARLSGAPPVLEVARGDEAASLTALLVAERITGFVDPVYVNSDMARGQFDEPLARNLYAETYAPVRETGFLVREEPTWKLGYSPDGLVGDDGLIEVKSPRAKTHLRTILNEEVPSYHMAQIQAGLLVTGREWLDFLSYSGGLPMWRKRVYPDQRWFDAIVTAVEQFERTAAQMIADYEAAVVGLPTTERILDLEMVI